MAVADVGQAVEIEKGWAPTPWSEATFRNELDIPFSRASVAVFEGCPDEVLGYVVRWVVAEESRLLLLAVRESARGHGVGKLLLDCVLAEARSAGLARVVLEVAADNSAARALYVRAGFAARGRRKGYYGKAIDGVVMERVLGRDVS